MQGGMDNFFVLSVVMDAAYEYLLPITYYLLTVTYKNRVRVSRR